MPIVIALVLIVALVILGVSVVNAALSILWWLLAGLVIGAIARLLLPGRQALGLLLTALLGAVGGLIGGLVGSEALGLGAVAQFVLAVVAAMVLIAIVAGTWRGDVRGRV